MGGLWKCLFRDNNHGFLLHNGWQTFAMKNPITFESTSINQKENKIFIAHNKHTFNKLLEHHLSGIVSCIRRFVDHMALKSNFLLIVSCISRKKGQQILEILAKSFLYE